MQLYRDNRVGKMAMRHRQGQIPRSKTSESLDVVKVANMWLAPMSGAVDIGSYLSTDSEHQGRIMWLYPPILLIIDLRCCTLGMM